MICLTTNRLVLKPLQATDMTRLVELIGTPEVVNNLSQVPSPYTLKDAEEWLAVVSGEKFNLNIFLDDALIGAVALSDNHDGSYELGYWVGSEYWGCGYATEAAAGLLEFAAAQINPLNVSASVFQGNYASANVLKKLGFNATGEGEVFSLSRQEQVATKKYIYKG